MTSSEETKARFGQLLARKQELLIRKGLATNIAEELLNKTNGYQAEIKELKQRNKSLVEVRKLAQRLNDMADGRVNSLSLAVKQGQMRLDKYKKMAEEEREKKMGLDNKNREARLFKEKTKEFLTEFKKSPWIPEREKLSKRLEDERRVLSQTTESLTNVRSLISEKEAIVKSNEEMPFQKFCVQAAALSLKKKMLTKKFAVELVKYNKQNEVQNDSILDATMDESQTNEREQPPATEEEEEIEEMEPEPVNDKQMEALNDSILDATMDESQTNEREQPQVVEEETDEMEPEPQVHSGSEAQASGDFFSFFGGDGATGQNTQNQSDDFGFNFNMDISQHDSQAGGGGFNFNLDMTPHDEQQAGGAFDFNF